MPTSTSTQGDDRQSLGSLWFGLLAAPAAWFVHLAVSYSLVGPLCASGSLWVLHLVSAASLLLALAGLRAAVRSWRGGPAARSAERVQNRVHFMAVSGVLLSAYFVAILLLAWAPAILVDGCDAL